MFQFTTEFYSSCREQFLVSTNWTKHSWKTIHAIASPTKSIFALPLHSTCCIFYCILFIRTYACCILVWNCQLNIKFLWEWGKLNEWNLCLCTECTALWRTLCSRDRRFLDGASTAQTVQGWAKTVCSTEFNVKQYGAVFEVCIKCSHYGADGNHPLMRRSSRIGTTSTAKAGWNGTRITRLFLLCCLLNHQIVQKSKQKKKCNQRMLLIQSSIRVIDILPGLH